MSLNLVADAWEELKRFIIVTDRTEAADSLVNILIDNDVSSQEIRDAFRGDTDIKRSLDQFGDDGGDDGDDYDYDEEDYEED
jgi:hypothetical protein